MDKDNDPSYKKNLIRILEEHSYHKMRKNTPTTPRRTHIRSSDKSLLSNSKRKRSSSKRSGSSSRRTRSQLRNSSSNGSSSSPESFVPGPAVSDVNPIDFSPTSTVFSPSSTIFSPSTGSSPTSTTFNPSTTGSCPSSTIFSSTPADLNLNEGNVVDGCANGKSGVQRNMLQGNVKQTLFSKDKSMKKARVEDIIKNIKKGKTFANKKQTVDNDNSSFVSMCTIREEPDDIELIDLPPLKASLPQPEVKHDNNAVIFLQTDKQTPVVYLDQRVKAASNTQASINQVINPNLIQRNFQKQVKHQIPLLLSKDPAVNILRSHSLSDKPTNQTQHLLSNPPGSPKQFLLITRPKNPVFQAGEVNGASMTPLTGNTSNIVTIPRSGSEVAPVDTSSLITVQYHLPYPNNVCKIVSNPSPVKYSYQAAPGQTLGNLYSLKGNETISISTDGKPTLIKEIPRAQKSMEIPVSLSGNQPVVVTSISDEPEALVESQSRFVPSFVYGNSHESFSTSGIVEKHIDAASGVEVTSKTGFAVKHSRQGSKTKANRATGQKKAGGLQSKNIPFSLKNTTNVSKIRANFPGSVDLDDISRTLSSQQSKADQAKETVASVRVSHRMKHRTEKAKLLETTKKRTIKNKKESLKLRLAKKGNMKEKMQVKIKTEVLDECDVRDSSLVSPKNTNKSADLSALKVHSNTRDGGTSSGEVVNSSEDGDESGNLFRDPALLTREERALQRALLMFKEMEAKQSRKNLLSQGNTMVHKSKRSLGRGIKIRKLNKTAEGLRKRKLGANENTFVKKRKINAEKQSLEKQNIEMSTKLAVHAEEPSEKKVDVQTNLKKRRIQSDELVHKKTIQKHPVKKQVTDCIEGRELSSKAVEECKKIKLVKDVTNIPKPLKLAVQPPEKSTDSSHEKAHRVKTYMLVPSYHGFQDFSPIVLGSRTRNKKVDKVKSDPDDEVIPIKKAEGPKKDIPLLVIETVNNKPVKQDVVAQDEQMRDFVKSSLRAQGMLKKELIEKSNEDDQFENREKRNLTVNRNTGETVLHKAARMGYDETVYHSIQQGCNSNAKDYAGWTPLHEACSRGHPDVVKVLLKYNADVNACSNDGIRPIHDAADNGHTDVLRLLIAYGADPMLNTYSGRSCVDCAKNPRTKDYIKSCIGDLYLTDERNNVSPVDYEDRWEFRGSCSVLDKDAKYMNGIFDSVPEQKPNTSIEFEWSDVPHLPTYNLPLIKDDVIVGRKNFIILKDLQESLGKSRNSLIKMLKRTEIRKVPWLEFCKEVSKSSFSKLSEPLENSSTEQENIELVPLNWNVRSLLKIRSKNIAL